MSVYRRYASGEHDKEYFQEINSKDKDEVTTDYYIKRNSIIPNTSDSIPINLYPLNGQFNTTDNDYSYFHIIMADWMSVFEYASYFIGYDESKFGNVLIMVFKNMNSGKICTRSITKFGFTCYDNLILSPRSRFWPACENLLPEYKQSKMRKSLAITNLKNYNKIANNPGIFPIDSSWDETNAGSLANSMTLIKLANPQELGSLIMQLGLVQNHTINSLQLDVVYDNSDHTTKTPQENHELITLLGQRTEHIFDPLLEYSPEIMQINYVQPSAPAPKTSNREINLIIDELILVQTNYSMGLVNLLQNFIIPLRINVLESTDIKGIAKLNKIFPPTIDEITRINCILHDALTKAQEFGHQEIFTVLVMILPYFYKPFIRHEANLKHFSLKLKKFYQKQQIPIFENPKINKGGYSTREIDSIVCGSIAELPKLKLIVNRIFSAINQDETIKLKDKISIEMDYRKIITTIDAFGTEEEANEIDVKSRVFTPTGKILTELASNWPAELQYGWLTRRVIGIFEFRNVKPVQNISPIEVLVIFSDHLLFLTVMDDTYSTNDSEKQISVADLLMHSLVNQKPISNFAEFPSMKVSCWCSISDVLISCYNSAVNTDEQGEFIKFLSTSSKGFSLKNSMEPIFSKSYQVLNKSGENQVNNQQIVELINKAKILNKSQPFHLFKSTKANFRMYSTAHEMAVYEQETCRSPFALLLNIQIDDLREYMKSNPALELLIHAKYVEHDNIQVSAIGKAGDYQINETISHKQFQPLIKEILSKNLHLYMKYDRDLTLSMVSGSNKDIDYVVKKFTRDFQNDKVTSESSEDLLATKATDVNKINPKPILKEKSIIQNQEKTIDPKSTKKRKSFLHFLMKPFKKQKVSTPKQAETKRNISHTFIPKGEELKASHLLLPLPEIGNENLKSQTVAIPKSETNTILQSSNNIYNARASKNLADLDVSTTRNLSETSNSDIVTNASVLRKNYDNIANHTEKLNKGSMLLDQITTKSNIITASTENEDALRNGDRRSLISGKTYAPSISEVNILETPSIMNKGVEYNATQVKQFYLDGAKNWVAISRDNSSVFMLDADKLVSQIESEGTFELDEVSNDTTNLVDDFVTHFEDDDFEFTPKEELRVTSHASNGSSFQFSNGKRDLSVQSLTPSMYASNLEREIEQTFTLDKLGESESRYDLLSSGRSYGRLQKINESVTSLASTENEFYSPDEYDEKKQYGNDVYGISDEDLELGSSEATIIEVDAPQPSSRKVSDSMDGPQRSVSGKSDHAGLASMMIQKLRISSGHSQH